jgi:restriction system protein
VLRNVTLPTADGTTQIDHIIVSEYGVFVIETKNMKGWIFGGARQRTWTQKIYKYTNKFQNPLHQNYKHVETLKALLELNDQQVFSVVVFVGDSTFKTEMPDNVVKSSGLIKYIKSKDQQVLFDADVQMILSKIEAERMVSSRKTTKEHIAHVNQIIEEKQSIHSSPKSIINETISSSDDGWTLEFESEPAFTDSWENRPMQTDEIHSKFTDRAFQ